MRSRNSNRANKFRARLIVQLHVGVFRNLAASCLIHKLPVRRETGFMPLTPPPVRFSILLNVKWQLKKKYIWFIIKSLTFDPTEMSKNTICLSGQWPDGFFIKLKSSEHAPKEIEK